MHNFFFLKNIEKINNKKGKNVESDVFKQIGTSWVLAWPTEWRRVQKEECLPGRSQPRKCK